MILEEESSEKKEMRMKIGNPKKGKTDMEKLLRLSSEERDFYKQMGSAGAPQYNRGQNPSSQMSQISGSAMPIHAITADPDDPELQIFESGVEEVDRYFKEVRWFNRAKGVPSLQTYKFLDPEGRMVGYGAVGRRNTEVPDGSGQKYRCLTIYVLGVQHAFQGKRIADDGGTTYAVAIYHFFAELAESLGGFQYLHLLVRPENSRAIASYKKAGFEADSGGPMVRKDGSVLLAMAKPLKPST